MGSRDILTIIGILAVPGIGAGYGYWIGGLGKRRGWRVHKVRRMAVIPIICPGGVALVTGLILELSGPGHSRLLPFGLIGGGTAALSKFVAVKRVRPGVPISVPDADDISIR